jgi:high affinity Mn2+ porin
MSGGVSINGKDWGRPDDTIDVAGVINGIAPVHQAFFNAGGLGISATDSFRIQASNRLSRPITATR